MSDLTPPPRAPSEMSAEMPDGDAPARVAAPAANEERAAGDEQRANDAQARNDSFNVPVKKNVIMIWALLNVGLVTFMAIMFYVLYQSQQN